MLCVAFATSRPTPALLSSLRNLTAKQLLVILPFMYVAARALLPPPLKTLLMCRLLHGCRDLVMPQRQSQRCNTAGRACPGVNGVSTGQLQIGLQCA